MLVPASVAHARISSRQRDRIVTTETPALPLTNAAGLALAREVRSFAIHPRFYTLVLTAALPEVGTSMAPACPPVGFVATPTRISLVSMAVTRLRGFAPPIPA